MLELIYNGTHMGILKSVGPVTITEGNNPVELRGVFDPAKEDVAAVSDLFGSYVSGRETFLDVRYVEQYKHSAALSSLFPTEEDTGMGSTDADIDAEGGQPTISPSRPPRWISEGLKSLSMRFPMPRDIMTLSSTSPSDAPASSNVGDSTDSTAASGSDSDMSDGISSASVGMVQSAKMDGLELIPLGESEISVRGSLTMEIVNPLGSAVPIDVYSIGTVVGLSSKNASGHPEADSTIKTMLGSLKVAPTTALRQSIKGANSITIVMTLNGTFEVDGDGSAFAEYVKEIQENDMAQLELEGEAQVRLTTTLGLLTLEGVAVRTQMDVKGFGGNLLGSSNAGEGKQKVSNMRFVGRDHEFGQGVGFEADYELFVPSAMSIYLGTVHFAMLHGGIRFGRFKINKMMLKKGRNNLKIFGVIDPSEADLSTVSGIFSRYLAGEEATMDVLGTDVYLDNGGKPLWLNTTVRALKQFLSLPDVGGAIGKSFGDVTVDGMGLSATSEKLRGMEDEAVAISANVAATVRSPFGQGSPVHVRKASIRLEVYWEENKRVREGTRGLEKLAKARRLRRSSGRLAVRRRLQETREQERRTHLGSLSVVGMTVEHVGQEVQMRLREAVLQFSDGGEKFAALALQLMHSTQPQMLSLVGGVDVVVDSDIGRLALENLPIETEYGFAGLDVFGKEERSGAMVGDAMRDLRVEDMNATDATDEENNVGALKLTSNLSLDNQSTMEVDLGTLFLDILYGGASLGTLAIPAFHMRPGPNELPIVGAVKPADMDVFSNFVSRYIAGEELTVKVKGKIPEEDNGGGISSDTIAKQLVREEGSGGDGRNPLWLQRVLLGVEMEVNIVGGLQESQFVNGASLDMLNVDLSGVGFPIISGRISANYKLPERFHISHEILRVDSDLDMKLLPPPPHAISSPQPRPRLLGSMQLRGLQPASTGTSPGAGVTFDLPLTTLEVPPHSEDDMSMFFSDVMHSSGDSNVAVKGVGSVLMRTALGDIHVQNIPIELQQTIKHYGDATRSGELFKMKDMQITSGSPDGLMLSSQLELQLPESKSKLAVNLGDVLFDMWLSTGEQGVDVRTVEKHSRELFEGGQHGGDQYVQIGLVQVPSFKMVPGELTETTAKAVLLRPIMGVDGESLKVGVRTVLSRYVNGDDTEVVVRGNKSSVVNKYLSKAFEQYNSKFQLKGATEPMLKNVELDIKFVIFIPQIEAKSTMENPLPVPIEFRYANMTTYSADRPLGTMAVDYRSHPNIIPANSLHTLPAVRVVPKFEGGAMEIFRELLSGEALIHAVGYMEIAIDRYAVTLDVDMKDVPLSF
eukprot:GHVS01014362.1.p1 GENE.GHVS01014362.1~~GHVS01014362.1.p1  ORF type:complete len:1500 (-),score=253.65 GHVS01014362.1:271-4212(-)